MASSSLVFSLSEQSKRKEGRRSLDSGAGGGSSSPHRCAEAMSSSGQPSPLPPLGSACAGTAIREAACFRPGHKNLARTVCAGRQLSVSMAARRALRGSRVAGRARFGG